MHGTSIVPNNHVTSILPFYIDDISFLGGMLEEGIQYGLGFFGGHALKRMNMLREVDCRNVATFMSLEEQMATQEMLSRIDISVKVGSGQLLGMKNGMTSNEVLFNQKILETFIQITISSPHIGKGG